MEPQQGTLTIQTFLPHADYYESAAALDKRRLNKQITECYQLLNALLADGGWQHHPAAKMWSGHEGSLVSYASCCYHEFVDRGGTPSHKSWWKILNEYGHLPDKSPKWLGDEVFHSSHRGRLLHKGNLDIIAAQLKCHTKVKPREFIKDFFSLARKTEIRDLNVLQAASLMTYLAMAGAPEHDNWYDQFGWGEKPSDDYVWPEP